MKIILWLILAILTTLPLHGQSDKNFKVQIDGEQVVIVDDNSKEVIVIEANIKSPQIAKLFVAGTKKALLVAGVNHIQDKLQGVIKCLYDTDGDNIFEQEKIFQQKEIQKQTNYLQVTSKFHGPEILLWIYDQKNVDLFAIQDKDKDSLPDDISSSISLKNIVKNRIALMGDIAYFKNANTLIIAAKATHMELPVGKLRDKNKDGIFDSCVFVRGFPATVLATPIWIGEKVIRINWGPNDKIVIVRKKDKKKVGEGQLDENGKGEIQLAEEIKEGDVFIIRNLSSWEQREFETTEPCPYITSVTPYKVSLEGGKVYVEGYNLDKVTKVIIEGLVAEEQKEAKIIKSSQNLLEFIAPPQKTFGTHLIILLTEEGKASSSAGLWYKMPELTLIKPSYVKSLTVSEGETIEVEVQTDVKDARIVVQDWQTKEAFSAGSVSKEGKLSFTITVKGPFPKDYIIFADAEPYNNRWDKGVFEGGVFKGEPATEIRLFDYKLKKESKQ